MYYTWVDRCKTTPAIPAGPNNPSACTTYQNCGTSYNESINMCYYSGGSYSMLVCPSYAPKRYISHYCCWPNSQNYYSSWFITCCAASNWH